MPTLGRLLNLTPIHHRPASASSVSYGRHGVTGVCLLDSDLRTMLPGRSQSITLKMRHY